jgi:hypothetical protein
LTCSLSVQQQSPNGVPVLPTVGNPPRDVLAVLRAHAARAGRENQLLAMGAQPLSGGRNNAAYRWCADLADPRACGAGIDNKAWTGIIGLAGLDRQNRRRFEAAQRACALRWLAVLWKERDTGTDEFTSQFDRARRLRSAAAAIRADRAASCP